MRLYLAVAVLLLALVAFAEAQDVDIQQMFRQWGERITEAGTKAAEKLSDLAEKARVWGSEQIKKINA